MSDDQTQPAESTPSGAASPEVTGTPGFWPHPTLALGSLGLSWLSFTLVNSVFMWTRGPGLDAEQLVIFLIAPAYGFSVGFALWAVRMRKGLLLAITALGVSLVNFGSMVLIFLKVI